MFKRGRYQKRCTYMYTFSLSHLNMLRHRNVILRTHCFVSVLFYELKMYYLLSLTSTSPNIYSFKSEKNNKEKSIGNYL